MTTEDFLAEFLAEGPNHVQAVILGGAGSGKSHFIKWLEFRVLDAIWGNGENTLKLLRAIVVVHLLIAFYDTYHFGNPWDLTAYLTSLAASPGVFFGIATPHPYPIWFSSIIAATRLVGFAFLTAILVKRFGRR